MPRAERDGDGGDAPVRSDRRRIDAALADGAPRVKRHTDGTHRFRSPEETLARVAPLLPGLGVTRVATITGLDRVGVPVTLAVRPASRALAVSQGKGLTLAAARVSAIMESIETYHAERIDRPLRLGSARELAPSIPLAAVERLPRSSERAYSVDARLLWIEAREARSGSARWVPYECVHTDFRWPRLDGSGYFLASTNGLAAGNHRLEAFAHALYELIERDALALAAARADDAAIDPASIDEPCCRALLDRLDAAGLDVLVRDRTSDVGVACFEALVAGRDDASAIDAEFGSGCHPDRGVALLRALTEAVQGRTTFISGSRDDYGDAPYADAARHARLVHCRGLFARARAETRFGDAPDLARARLDEELDGVLERLVAAGIDEPLWVDLERSEFGVPVVRVLAPGLEGPCRADDYVPGERARRHTAGPGR